MTYLAALLIVVLIVMVIVEGIRLQALDLDSQKQNCSQPHQTDAAKVARVERLKAEQRAEDDSARDRMKATAP